MFSWGLKALTVVGLNNGARRGVVERCWKVDCGRKRQINSNVWLLYGASCLWVIAPLSLSVDWGNCCLSESGWRMVMQSAASWKKEEASSHQSPQVSSLGNVQCCVWCISVCNPIVLWFLSVNVIIFSFVLGKACLNYSLIALVQYIQEGSNTNPAVYICLCCLF